PWTLLTLQAFRALRSLWALRMLRSRGAPGGQGARRRRLAERCLLEKQPRVKKQPHGKVPRPQRLRPQAPPRRQYAALAPVERRTLRLGQVAAAQVEAPRAEAGREQPGTARDPALPRRPVEVRVAALELVPRPLTARPPALRNDGFPWPCPHPLRWLGAAPVPASTHLPGAWGVRRGRPGRGEPAASKAGGALAGPVRWPAPRFAAPHRPGKGDGGPRAQAAPERDGVCLASRARRAPWAPLEEREGERLQ